MKRRWSAAVVIPARDEARHIGRSVSSVLSALDAAQPAWSTVVVVADRCSDTTAEVAARRLGSRGELLLTSAGSAGLARRRGVARALRCAECPLEKL